MWFLFAFAAFFAWGAADLFYKKGNNESEKYSHLKTSIAVGIVMGIVAFCTLLLKNVDYDFRNLLIYLPVSLMYILSMTVGYFGLRYLSLSVSSPIQNTSGAVSCILLIIFLKKIPPVLSIIAVVLITLGVVILGVAERKNELTECDENKNKKYIKGLTAFFIPVIYCIIDSLGTFLDGIYLDDVNSTPLINVTEDNLEDVANISYELTFLLAAIILFLYVFVIKKEKICIKNQYNGFIAAAFEAGGQLAYVYALSGNAAVAAPMIGSYCICSAILARIFLKEKVTFLQKIGIISAICGIVLLGISEG